MSRGEKKQKTMLTLVALLFVGAGVFLVAGPASAQLQLLGEAVGLDCKWAQGETFGLAAFTQLAINVLKLIWGVLGSLALVMFVWGGFLWLTARGEEQQIKQGWDTLINAVIGLAIVLGSWVIINTIVLSLTSPGTWGVGQLFGGTAWTELVKGEVCVKIAARDPGFVPGVASPARTAPTGTRESDGSITLTTQSGIALPEDQLKRKGMCCYKLLDRTTDQLLLPVHKGAQYQTLVDCISLPKQGRDSSNYIDDFYFCTDINNTSACNTGCATPSIKVPLFEAGAPKDQVKTINFSTGSNGQPCAIEDTCLKEALFCSSSKKCLLKRISGDDCAVEGPKACISGNCKNGKCEVLQDQGGGFGGL